MKILSKTLSLAAAAALTTLIATPAQAALTWLTDFEKAKAQAEKEKKDIVMDFTGSDWCGWCIKLHDEVFSKKEFEDAAKKFVFVTIDFPQDKTLLSKDEKEQEAISAKNDKLQTEFGVQGYPTLVLTDAKGVPYATTGYEEGGPKPFLANLDKLQAKRVSRDAAFAKADAAPADKKAELLVAALKEIPEDMLVTRYADRVAELRKADPEDKSGMGKKLDDKAKIKELETKLQETVMKEHEAGGEPNGPALIKMIDDFIATNKLDGNAKQEATLMKLAALNPAKDLAAIKKVLTDVVGMGKDTEVGKQAVEIQKQIDEMEKADASPKDLNEKGDLTGDGGMNGGNGGGGDKPNEAPPEK